MACVPLKPDKAISIADARRIAEILDELERASKREDFRTFDVLDVVGKPTQIAVEGEIIAKGVFGDGHGILDLGAELREPLVDLGAALGDLAVNRKAAPKVVLLRQLEARPM